MEWISTGQQTLLIWAHLSFLGSINLLDLNLRITLLGPQVYKLGYSFCHWVVKIKMPFLGASIVSLHFC